MKINIKVIPKAKQNAIKKEEETYKIWTIAPPVEGKANKIVIELLSSYFNIKKSQIKIIRGKKSRDKIIEIKS